MDVVTAMSYLREFAVLLQTYFVVGLQSFHEPYIGANPLMTLIYPLVSHNKIIQIFYQLW